MFRSEFFVSLMYFSEDDVEFQEIEEENANLFYKVV